MALLKTITPLAYSPLPKLIIPKRIYAQYETKVPKNPISFTSRYGRNPSYVKEIITPALHSKDKLEVI